MKLQLARLIKNICYAAGCASAVLSLALKSAPQTAQRWLLFGGIALLVLGFLVSVTFYRCPHCSTPAAVRWQGRRPRQRACGSWRCDIEHSDLRPLEVL